VLDERGRDLDTPGLAGRMRAWQEDARPVAILIGGPDGLDPALKARADEAIRLSSLTLPHPLVRVLLAEQLYRGWSILAGHPYHRS
jgi:23S rRNA (pseudouridine1915-N3)-methyltransferase